ncbi:protein cramped-like isoform X2 [Acanthaster planci]|uniref:Protein cramped-like isoform X2 n=1 Tax=Acanthaster planci TaxID=133434 RepID=A0A8B7Z026_ACAPL|nr:protein cramped-like isoform X2 [Acanthaster planci]
MNENIRKRVQVQPGTNEEISSDRKVIHLEESAEMKASHIEGVVSENGPTQSTDTTDLPAPETKQEQLAPVRPPLNHPFLRSSVKRKKKEPTPPPSPPKPDETEKAEVKPDRKRCWEAWSDGETTLFFEAVNEYGKDFDAIQKYIDQRHKKLGLAAHQVKNKNQVRHLYYRTCHKLFTFISPKPDQERTVSELFALINFGELRKKLNLKGGITRKVGQRLNQLVTTGQTVIRVRGQNRRVKTPLCKALRKLKGDENKSDPYKLPAHVLMELQPRNNKAWASVQGTAHNPRVRLMISLKKNLSSIISYLNEKWTPHRSKLLNTLKPTGELKDSLRLRLVLPEGVEVTPHNQVTGRYMHSDSRAVFSLDTEARVTKAVAASKAAKIQRAAAGNVAMPSTRTPTGSSLDCTKDVPGLDKTAADKANCDSTTAGGKPRKYKPRKKAKLAKIEECTNDVGDQEVQLVNIVTSNHGRKSEDLESMEISKSDSSKSPVKPEVNETEKIETEEAVQANAEKETIPLKEMEWTVAPAKEFTKDEQLMGELSAQNSKNLTMTDIYLMLNMPTRLKFEYEFVKDDSGSGNNKSSSESNLLHKLFAIASTEFTDIRKPRRSVSVGTVTSPPRFNAMPGTNATPPSKASFISQLSKSPSNARGQRSATSNGMMRVNSRPTAKPSGGGNAKDKDSGVFVTPAVPSPQPHCLASVESSTTAAEKLFMAQIESLQKQPTFLKPNSRRGRKPLVVQRTLLPRPQSEHKGPTRHMMSMSKTGQFTPVQLAIPDSVCQKTIVRPVPIAPGPAAAGSLSGSASLAKAKPSKASMPSNTDGTSSPVVSYVASSVSSKGPSMVASPLSAPSPVSSLALSTPTALLPGGVAPMNEIEAASAAAGIDITLRPSPPEHTQPAHLSPLPINTSCVPCTEPTKTPMLNPSPQIIDDTMEIVSVTPSSSFEMPETSATLGTGGTVGQNFAIPAPNLSSLLENSLPSSAAAGGGDGLMDIPMGSESFTGFNQQLSPNTSNPSVMLPSMSPVRGSGTTTPPLHISSPSSSPFKLNSLSPDNQWLNGENVDISLSSILANLESPEKKERHSIISSTSGSLTIPQPSLMIESSRDSSMSKDVDTHLQYMMNENSVDYVAKFADLAAQITAQQEAQKETTVSH